MSGEQSAFEPLYVQSGPNQTGTLVASVTVAATDANVASARLAGGNQNNFTQLQISNVSSSWAYVNFGVFGSVAAATVASSYPVPPNSVAVVTVDDEVSGATVILGTPAATGSVIFTRGAGL